MADPSESVLVRKAVMGDRGALSRLLESHQHRLYNVVLRMVSNREDASELTQDAMLRIIQHIETFDGQAAFSTWAIRIAMNLSISHLRKRKRRSTLSLDGAAGSGNTLDNQAAPLRDVIADHREPGPAQRVQQEEMLTQLHGALGELDDGLRAILVLRDIQQMDYARMAEVLAIPVGTVKSRLFRARLALRKLMYVRCPVDAPATLEASGAPGVERSVSSAKAPAMTKAPSDTDTERGQTTKARAPRPEFPPG